MDYDTGMMVLRQNGSQEPGSGISMETCTEKMGLL